jgi:tetratricopeptide (TPR) repeat protein
MGHWEQALQINPDLVEALDNLGAALLRLGRVPEAIARYEQALRINPDDAEARNSLAHLRSPQ